MTDPQPDFRPQPGVPEPLEPGLRRILAPNPSAMTFRGTNTYLLGQRGLAVIDPGPDDDDHLQAILRAVGPDQHVSHILVTHAHLDHSPLARRLAEHTGAPVLAFGPAEAGRSVLMQALAGDGRLGGGEGVDLDFRPDRLIGDGDIIAGDDWRVDVLHLPGHMANHLGFAWNRTLFSGDLVMGWATSLVSPPDGDLAAFMASLSRLQDHPWERFYPGHGAVVRDPAARLDGLRRHRLMRRDQILQALGAMPATPGQLTRRIYTDLAVQLLPAAERNVLAHLIELLEQGIVTHDGPLTGGSAFRRN